MSRVYNTRENGRLESYKWKAGDPRPEGYGAFHEWAAAQHKAGLRQRRCRHCGKWRFPQEFPCCEPSR